MKNFIFLVSVVTMLLFVFHISLAAEPVVQASFSVNPSVSAPGSDGYIQVTLKNTGSALANNVKVTLTSTDAGINVDPYRYVDIGGIGTSETTSALFKFSVPKTTSSGLYRINFEIDYCQDSNCREIKQFAIVNVQSQSILELKSLKPDRLNIGSNTTLIFAVANNGNSELSNVVITWQESNNLILPLGSSNRIILSSIGADQQIEIPVEVVTSPTITPGTYPITVKMEYFDKTGTKQNSTSVVGLIVGGMTEFAVDIQEFTASTLTLSIANIGVNPATSIAVRIPAQERFSVMGSSSVFLGNLNPGDYTIASFQVIPRSNATRGDLAVEILYTDTTGTRQTAQEKVSLNLAGGFDEQQFRGRLMQGQRPNNGVSGLLESRFVQYLLIGAIVIAGLMFFFKFRKRKGK